MLCTVYLRRRNGRSTAVKRWYVILYVCECLWASTLEKQNNATSWLCSCAYNLHVIVQVSYNSVTLMYDDSMRFGAVVTWLRLTCGSSPCCLIFCSVVPTFFSSFVKSLLLRFLICLTNPDVLSLAYQCKF